MMEDRHEAIEGVEVVAELAPGELSLEEKQRIYSTAVWRVRLRFSLYIHAVVYAAVMVLLILINLATNSGTLWFVWPLVGWGAGLIIHALAVMKLLPLYERMKDAEIVRQLEIRQGH
jgi:hypothetical protein